MRAGRTAGQRVRITLEARMFVLCVRVSVFVLSAVDRNLKLADLSSKDSI
jgi:hypothetical protein